MPIPTIDLSDGGSVTGRQDFGGTASDFTYAASSGFVRPRGGTLTFWSEQVGGIQYTDLLFNNQAAVEIPVPNSGQIPVFQGPPDVVVMWAEDGVESTERVAIVASIGLINLSEASVAQAQLAATDANAAKNAAQAVGATTAAQVKNAIDTDAATKASLDAATGSQLDDPASAARRSATKTYARGISLTQPEFGAVLGTVATHQAAFEAAIAAASAARVSLHVPGGQWTANNLNGPTELVMWGDGIQKTRIRRSADAPIIKSRGDAYTGSGAFFPSIFGQRFQDLTFYNPVVGATQPLIDLAGVSALNMHRVQFESYQDGPSCLRLAQVWDSQFNDCLFASGGNSSGTNPVVHLIAGFVDGATTYRQTKEIAFNGCHWEDYYGAAVSATRPEGYTDSKVEQIKFSGRSKMESLRSSVPHMSFVANHLDFTSSHYVRHWLNTGAVVDFVNVRGAKGALRFFGSNVGTGYVKPSARLNVPSVSQFIDLDVQVAEPQASDENVLTLATPRDETNRLRINAPFPLLNGVSVKNMMQVGQYWIYVTANGTVRRSVGFPALGTEGVALYDVPVVSSANLNDITHPINTAEKYQGKQVYCTSTARFVHTNGSAANAVWLNADGTTSHTPV